MNSNQLISNERLAEIAEDGFLQHGDSRAMAAELLTLRNSSTSTQPVSQRYKLPDGFIAVPRTLTAENGAKAALIGEFNLEYNLVCHECFGEGCDDCNGEGRWINSIPVDWSTIKEIWARGIEHFESAAQEVE